MQRSEMTATSAEELEAIRQVIRPQQRVTGLLAEFANLSDFGACMIPLLISL